MNDWKMRGKEKSPEETIDKIKKILRTLGLKTSIQDFESGVENCYSCRLTIEGATRNIIGTNGKGMTRELCHASAYGEMMERMENRIFFAMPRFDDPKIEDVMNEIFPLYDVWSEEQPFAVKYLKKRIAETIKKNHPVFSKEYIVNSTIEKLAPKALNGKFMTLPFYSVSDNRIEYLPSWMLFFTGSNGMAAGNTFEEAMVEGLSEILERYSQMAIFDGEIIPPQIPRDFIARFPHIMNVIENIEASGRYKVRLLDCSLGKNLPVVAGVVTDLETGGMGVKFGSQPNIAVAMERVFTEAMQGTNLQKFANRSKPVFDKKHKFHHIDKWNCLKTFSASSPAQLLMNDSSYPFIPWGEEQGLSNNEMMWSIIRLMEDSGSKIYVYDASYLGFPAVNIYATGFSEIKPVDFTEIKQNLLAQRVQEYFTKIDLLSDEQVAEIATLAAYKRGSVMENTINFISQLFFAEDFLFAPFDADVLYAACMYHLGNISEARSVFSKLSSFSDKMVRQDDKLIIKAVNIWMDGLVAGEQPDKIYQVICHLYPQCADKVRDIFGEPKQVLKKLYPICGGKPCTEIIEGGSCYAAIHDFYKMLYDAEKKNPINPEKIRAVFKNRHSV